MSPRRSEAGIAHALVVLLVVVVAALAIVATVDREHGSRPSNTSVSSSTPAASAPNVALGLAVQDAGAGHEGVVVAAVHAGSGAAAAGLHAGDVLVSVNGAAVATRAQLEAAVAGLAPGDAVRVGWLDVQNQFHFASVSVTRRPSGR